MRAGAFVLRTGAMTAVFFACVVAWLAFAASFDASKWLVALGLAELAVVTLAAMLRFILGLPDPHAGQEGAVTRDGAADVPEVAVRRSAALMTFAVVSSAALLVALLVRGSG
jgi:hypothetical protein